MERTRSRGTMKQPRISAVEPLKRPLAIRVTWIDGTHSDIDLSDPVATDEHYAALREGKVFEAVRVGEWGWYVEWPGGLDMPADGLWRKALEQRGLAMPPREFRAWREANGLSLTRAAEVLGLSRRMVAYYDSGQKLIPKYIRLACKGAAAERMEPARQRGGAGQSPR